jgi:hypothetical protein
VTNLVSYLEGHGIDWWAAAAQWAGIVVALGGLFFVWIQVRALARQQMLAARAATSLLYGVVSEAMYRVNNVFYEHPGWVQYFYEAVEAPSRLSEAELLTQLDRVCELVMDFVDAVVEQKRVLPDEVSMDWSTWEAYFRYLYVNSPVLRTFIDENLDLYPDYFFAAFGYLVVREQNTGHILGTWIACEVDPDERDPEQVPDVTMAAGILECKELPAQGFPWNRTWIIRRKAKAAGQEASSTVVVAAVEGTGVDRAKVAFRWRLQSNETELPDRERKVLQYWVLGTMDGTGVNKVDFKLATTRTTYSIRRRKAPRGTDSFLIPEYRRSLAWHR